VQVIEYENECALTVLIKVHTPCKLVAPWVWSLCEKYGRPATRVWSLCEKYGRPATLDIGKEFDNDLITLFTAGEEHLLPNNIQISRTHLGFVKNKYPGLVHIGGCFRTKPDRCLEDALSMKAYGKYVHFFKNQNTPQWDIIKMNMKCLNKSMKTRSSALTIIPM
jgi:hypothetical protein